MRTFGEILKTQRQKLGLTQKQLANAIGMSDAYICSLESDKKSPPPYYTVLAIADVLKMDPEQLWKVAVKHRERQAIERVRKRVMSRRRVDEKLMNDAMLNNNTESSIPDSQINDFFARPEIRMSALGLFRKQLEEMTMEEKRYVYQAINKVIEFVDGSSKNYDSLNNEE